MTDKLEKKLVYLVLVIFAIIQCFVLFFGKSDYGFGGADNIAHYQIAKYAFKYPELFLDLWGKPVYTTFVAPFAIFGYKAAKLFNILVSILTLLLTAKVSQHLFKEKGLYSVALLAFAPIYFFLAVSCLTEMLFAFALVASVFLFVKAKYSLSAIVISFLPFIRSEGIVILPVFLLAFVLKKSYRSILFLAVGAVFYSIIGYFVFNDLLWIINRQPYSMGESVYGSGSLFHFIKKSNYIFGVPLLILLVAGLGYWLWDLARIKSLRDNSFVLFVLIAGSWIIYFAAHSYVWWKGTGGSLGLIRVMGGILPLAVLTVMKSFDFAFKRKEAKKPITAVYFLFAVAQIVLFFTQNKILPQADATEQLLKKTAQYIRSNENGERIFYYNPMIVHFLELDPYDSEQCNWWTDKMQPSNSMNWGDLLVWDAHFGPNEGGVKPEALEQDPYLQKIKSFYPVEKITVLGGYDYAIHIYEKVKQKNDSNVEISDNFLREIDFSVLDSENIKTDENIRYWLMDNMQEYSQNIIVYPNEIEKKDIFEIEVTVNYKEFEVLAHDEVLLVLSVEAPDQKLRYEAVSLPSSKTWGEQKINTRIPCYLPDNAKIMAYIWNKDKKEFGIRKLSVQIKSL